jgi:hypothetical protein
VVVYAIAEEEVELDVWTSVIATVEEPHGIGSCPDEKLSLYINNLRMLWKLGPAQLKRRIISTVRIGLADLPSPT